MPTITYHFFDSGFFIPVYSLLLILTAVAGNLLAKREKKIFGGVRGYNADALLISFVVLLSLLYSFTFSHVAFHYREAKLFVSKESDMGAGLFRWSNHFKYDEKRKFQLMLTEYFEIRADMEKSIDSVLINKSHNDMWNFLMEKEKLEVNNAVTLKMLNQLENEIQIYWNQYYGEKDRLPMPVIMLIFTASILITFFVGYSNLNTTSHFTINLFIFVSLNMIIMFTIRELDLLHKGLIEINRDNIVELAKAMRSMYETGK